MRLNCKYLYLAMLAVLPVVSAGCSGINASGSVSPASFFLPGLMKVDPPSSRESPQPGEVPPPAPNDPARQIALAR